MLCKKCSTALRIKNSYYAISGGDISDEAARKRLQNKVFDSVSRHIPYEYMGECNCGRQKFYEYRRELCRRVAEEMGMVASFEAPQRQNSESAPFGDL